MKKKKALSILLTLAIIVTLFPSIHSGITETAYASCETMGDDCPFSEDIISIKTSAESDAEELPVSYTHEHLTIEELEAKNEYWWGIGLDAWTSYISSSLSEDAKISYVVVSIPENTPFFLKRISPSEYEYASESDSNYYAAETIDDPSLDYVYNLNNNSMIPEELYFDEDAGGIVSGGSVLVCYATDSVQNPTIFFFDYVSRSSICTHVWIDATCVAAKHCEKCGKIDGEPTGNHIYGKYGKCTACDKRLQLFVVDMNGGSISGHPSWYMGTVREDNYAALGLTKAEAEKYNGCYYGFYEGETAYIYYDETHQTPVFDDGDAEGGFTSNVNTIKAIHYTPDEEDAADPSKNPLYLVRPTKTAGVLSAWQAAGLGTNKVSKTYANNKPQLVGKGLTGNVVFTAEFSDQYYVIALPKATDELKFDYQQGSVNFLLQRIESADELRQCTGKADTVYDDENYNYYILGIDDYTNIWLNVHAGSYIPETAKALYVTTESGKQYLKLWDASTVKGSYRYHVVGLNNTTDQTHQEINAIIGSADAYSQTQDGVIYIELEEGAIKPSNIEIPEAYGLSVFRTLQEKKARPFGANRRYQSSRFDNSVDGFTIRFYDDADQEIKDLNFAWGSAVKFKIFDEDGNDAKDQLRVFYNNCEAPVQNAQNDFGGAYEVVTGYDYSDYGKIVSTNSKLFVDGELTVAEDGYYHCTLNPLWDAGTASGTQRFKALIVADALEAQKVRTANEILHRSYFAFDIRTCSDIQAAYQALKAYYDANSDDETKWTGMTADTADWAKYLKSYPLFRYQHDGEYIAKLGMQYTIDALKAVWDAQTIPAVRKIVQENGQFMLQIEAAYKDGNGQYMQDRKTENTEKYSAQYAGQMTANGYTIIEASLADLQMTAGKEVVADASQTAANGLASVKIPVDKLRTIADNDGTLTIKTDMNTVKYSQNAVKKIAYSEVLAQADTVNASQYVYFTLAAINKGDIESNSLSSKGFTESQKQVISSAGKDVVDLTISSAYGANIPLLDSEVTVTIPYTLSAGEIPSAVKVWYINNRGRVSSVGGKYHEEDGTVTFTTSHFSAYMPYHCVTKKESSEKMKTVGEMTAFIKKYVPDYTTVRDENSSLTTTIAEEMLKEANLSGKAKVA